MCQLKRRLSVGLTHAGTPITSTSLGPCISHVVSRKINLFLQVKNQEKTGRNYFSGSAISQGSPLSLLELLVGTSTFQSPKNSLLLPQSTARKSLGCSEGSVPQDALTEPATAQCCRLTFYTHSDGPAQSVLYNTSTPQHFITSTYIQTFEIAPAGLEAFATVVEARVFSNRSKCEKGTTTNQIAAHRQFMNSLQTIQSKAL